MPNGKNNRVYLKPKRFTDKDIIKTLNNSISAGYEDYMISNMLFEMVLARSIEDLSIWEGLGHIIMNAHRTRFLILCNQQMRTQGYFTRTEMRKVFRLSYHIVMRDALALELIGLIYAIPPPKKKRGAYSTYYKVTEAGAFLCNYIRDEMKRLLPSIKLPIVVSNVQDKKAA